MSGTSHKASNRKIRRAFGSEPLRTIDNQGVTIQYLIRVMGMLDTRLMEIEKKVADLERPSRWQRCRAWLGAR